MGAKGLSRTQLRYELQRGHNSHNMKRVTEIYCIYQAFIGIYLYTSVTCHRLLYSNNRI